jgi:hypothetical protein
MSAATVELVRIDCECNALSCPRKILAPLDDPELQRADRFVIVDGCKYGPEPSDVLVAERQGYRLFRKKGVLEG